MLSPRLTGIPCRTQRLLVLGADSASALPPAVRAPVCGTAVQPVDEPAAAEAEAAHAQEALQLVLTTQRAVHT